jgi:hypothetical protein
MQSQNEQLSDYTVFIIHDCEVEDSSTIFGPDGWLHYILKVYKKRWTMKIWGVAYLSRIRREKFYGIVKTRFKERGEVTRVTPITEEHEKRQKSSRVKDVLLLIVDDRTYLSRDMEQC